MQDVQDSIPVLKTPQDIDRAVQQYRISDLKGFDLFRQWLAIRNASLEQTEPELSSDLVPGEASY